MKIVLHAEPGTKLRLALDKWYKCIKMLPKEEQIKYIDNVNKNCAYPVELILK